MGRFCEICGKKYSFFFGPSRAKPAEIHAAWRKGVDAPEDICSLCLEDLCKKHNLEVGGIKEILLSCLFSDPFEDVIKKISEHAQAEKIETPNVIKAIKSSLLALVDKSLEDGLLSAEEVGKLEALFSAYNITANDIDLGTKELLVKGNLIRNLMTGNIVRQVAMPPDLPFKLMKSEIPIWVFHCSLYEMRTKSKMVGGSQGFSVRVMKGVYWRVGKFEGERVVSEEAVSLGRVTAAITSKHLYFSVGLDSRRIKHDKIITIAPYEDGIAVISEGARAKPLIFVPDDTWFFVNVLQNAQNWDS